MSFVYFVQADYLRHGRPGPVKIGRAKNVAARIYELQISCPEQLTLLFSVDCGDQHRGASRLEAKLHRELADLHIRGEWFAWHEDIAAAIEVLGDPPRMALGYIATIDVIDVDAVVFHRSEGRG